MKDITKESLAQWISELESQPHLSLREERYLAVMKQLQEANEELVEMCVHCENLQNENSKLWGRLDGAYQK